MKRTQLQLDEPTHHLLWKRAFDQGVFLPALIRQVLHAYLTASPPTINQLKDFTFIGSGRSQPSRIEPISERHDEALVEDFAR